MRIRRTVSTGESMGLELVLAALLLMVVGILTFPLLVGRGF
jgi:hypothetical protein